MNHVRNGNSSIERRQSQNSNPPDGTNALNDTVLMRKLLCRKGFFSWFLDETKRTAKAYKRNIKSFSDKRTTEMCWKLPHSDYISLSGGPLRRGTSIAKTIENQNIKAKLANYFIQPRALQICHSLLRCNSLKLWVTINYVDDINWFWDDEMIVDINRLHRFASKSLPYFIEIQYNMHIKMLTAINAQMKSPGIAS